MTIFIIYFNKQHKIKNKKMFKGISISMCSLIQCLPVAAKRHDNNDDDDDDDVSSYECVCIMNEVIKEMVKVRWPVKESVRECAVIIHTHSEKCAPNLSGFRSSAAHFFYDGAFWGQPQ
jgi:hypothetical protein